MMENNLMKRNQKCTRCGNNLSRSEVISFGGSIFLGLFISTISLLWMQYIHPSLVRILPVEQISVIVFGIICIIILPLFYKKMPKKHSYKYCKYKELPSNKLEENIRNDLVISIIILFFSGIAGIFFLAILYSIF